MSLLQVDHLTVRFGSTNVVDDVSFTIAPGEKFALVGESGSGKTVCSAAPVARHRYFDDFPGDDDSAQSAIHAWQSDR